MRSTTTCGWTRCAADNAGSREREREMGSDTGVKYAKLQAKVDGRPPGTPVLEVQMGDEPEEFQIHFVGWSDKKAA